MDRRHQQDYHPPKYSGLDDFELHYLSLGSEPADTGNRPSRSLRYQNRYLAKRQVLQRVRRLRRSQLDEDAE